MFSCTQNTREKNINVCQGKSTTVLARKRKICKLLRWYLNNGEENELEKLLDGFLRRILLPPYTQIFVFSYTHIRWTDGGTNSIWHTSYTKNIVSITDFKTC